MDGWSWLSISCNGAVEIKSNETVLLSILARVVGSSARFTAVLQYGCSTLMMIFVNSPTVEIIVAVGSMMMTRKC